MSEINLENLSLDELKSLRKDVEKAISGFAERKRKEALNVLEEKARELGFTSLDAVTGKSGAKAKAAAKYRDPANSANTWSGRGRKPGWFTALVDAGTNPDDLLI